MLKTQQKKPIEIGSAEHKSQQWYSASFFQVDVMKHGKGPNRAHETLVNTVDNKYADNCEVNRSFHYLHVLALLINYCLQDRNNVQQFVGVTQ